MKFCRKILPVCVNVLLLGAGLLLCSRMVLAQRGGGASTGGGSVPGSNNPGGVNEKDELKNFHHAMAMQASSQQTLEFRALVKSAEAANREIDDLLKGLEKGNDASTVASRASALRQSLETARSETRQFLGGFSPAQKSGLKEAAGKLLKAESDLGEQEKMLDPTAADAKEEGIRIAGRAEVIRQALGKALANFRREQDSLGEEMGIVLSKGGQDLAFSIPPYKTPVTIANQPVALTTSAAILRSAAESGANVFKVEATTDLSDLQQNMTAILSAQLNKGERCGERIAVSDATLDPAIPLTVVVARLHYERWVCSRRLGGETSNEMAEGNATVEVKLTPAVGPDGELQIAPEMGRVEADRFLADLLRTGALGVAVRENMARSVLAAIVDLKSALPPAATDSAKTQSMRFESTRTGDLSVVVSGEMRLSEEQTKLLGSQLKERVASQAGGLRTRE